MIVSGGCLSGTRGATILTAKWLFTDKEEYANEQGTPSGVSPSYFLLSFFLESLFQNQFFGKMEKGFLAQNQHK